MYTNLTKGQAFPLAAKMSSQPRCFNSSHSLKIQSLPFGLYPKPYTKQLLFVSHSFFVNPINFSTELGNLANPTRYGLLVRNARQYCLSIRARTLSSSVVRPEKQLPWLTSIFASISRRDDGFVSIGDKKNGKIIGVDQEMCAFIQIPFSILEGSIKRGRLPLRQSLSPLAGILQATPSFPSAPASDCDLCPHL